MTLQPAKSGRTAHETTDLTLPPVTSTLTKSSAGFTLVEILMVIMLVGILTTMAISGFHDFSSDARTVVTRERLNSIKAALVGDARFVSAGTFTKPGYEAHCLGSPTSLSDLVTMPGAGVCATAYDPFTKRGWRGPYVDGTVANWNADGWSTPFEYFSVGPPARTLRSCGPDLTCGTADDISVTF
jgi:prepilin-type N-terminal cleavage/methylation domain-containing protein